jgi:hypothetical protein
MTPREIRKLTEGFSVQVDGPAWDDIGKLKAEIFLAIRDRLLTLANAALAAAQPSADNDELQQVVSTHVQGHDVRFQVEFEREQVVLLSIRER